MSVYAIIIGVEHYDAVLDGIDIELDGPASDAVRFASWLLERGVPPDNLRVFLSALDPGAQRSRLNNARNGNNVAILEATRDQVETFFNNGLTALAQSPSTLYVLWGGHGVIRGGQEHHLFYANLRRGSPFTFNVEARLRQLRAVSNLATQHVFIDACANYVELTQFGSVDSATPIINDPDPTVKQDLIRAAASGQKAQNNKIERTGYFSHELLTLLDKCPADTWPTAKSLAPKLEQVFVEKAQNDRAFRQRPVWLSFRPYEGHGFELGSQPRPDHLQKLAMLAECSISQLNAVEQVLAESEKLQDDTVRDDLYELVVGTSQVSRSWRKDPAVDLAGLAAWTLHRGKIKGLADALDRKGDSSFRLIELVLQRVDLARQAIRLLDRIGLSSDQYRAAYRRTGHIASSEKRLDFFEDIVAYLADSDDLQRSPLFRFLLDLSTVVDDACRADIQEFLTKANPSYIADLLRTMPKNRTYRVLITVKQNPGSIWGQVLENDIPFGSKVERSLGGAGDFLAKLEELYSELISSIDGKVLIELILPFEELCENLEIAGIAPDLPIPVQPVPLCHSFPVMLRWLDRIMRPKRNGAEMWKRAASYIRQRLQQPGSKPSRFALPRQPGDSFWSKMDRPEGDLIDLGSDGSAPNKALLARALYHGVAFACWPRKDLSGATAKYDEFVDRLLNGTFAEIPLRAVEVRRLTELEAPVALFWDDPETDPTPLIKSFEEMRMVR